MESENSADFDEEIKVDADDVALNEHVFQILMQDVVVKQEDVGIDDNNRMEMVVDDGNGHGSQQNGTALKSLRNIIRKRLLPSTKVKSPMPKAIRHRRISLVERKNNFAFHRHLNRRQQPTPTVDIHNQSSSSGFSEAAAITEENSTDISNNEMSMDASTVSDSIDEGQSAIERNGSSELLNSTHTQHALGESSSGTFNVTPSTSVDPPDIGFQDSTIDSSEAKSQIFDADSAEEEDASEVKTNESTNMDVAQGSKIDINGVGYDISAPIVFNVQRIQPAEGEGLRIAAVNTIPVENRCEPCAYTFKTPKNLERHLKTKKHLQRMARMNR